VVDGLLVGGLYFSRCYSGRAVVDGLLVSGLHLSGCYSGRAVVDGLRFLGWSNRRLVIAVITIAAHRSTAGLRKVNRVVPVHVGDTHTVVIRVHDVRIVPGVMIPVITNFSVVMISFGNILSDSHSIDTIRVNTI